MIRYKGFSYVEADMPSGMAVSNPPANAKDLLRKNDKKKEREITRIKLPGKPKIYDPKIDESIETLTKAKQSFEEITISRNKNLDDLYDKYKIPSIKILLMEFNSSRSRLSSGISKVISDLEHMSKEDLT